MALASDPNRTFFRGINQVQTNTYQLIEKKRGEKKRENYSKSKFLFDKQFVATDRQEKSGEDKGCSVGKNGLLDHKSGKSIVHYYYF